MNFRLTHLGKSLALLGFAWSLGSLHAAVVLSPVPATAVALYCGNAATQVITVKPVSGTATIVITAATPLPAGLVMTPATQTLNVGNSAAGVTFTLSAPVCTGVAAGANAFTLTFKAGGVADATVAGTINASAVTVSPATLTIPCSYDGSKYVASSAQTVTVGATAAAMFTALQANALLAFTSTPTFPYTLSATTTATFGVTSQSTASGGVCTTGATTVGLLTTASPAGATSIYKVIPVSVTSVPVTPLVAAPT